MNNLTRSPWIIDTASALPFGPYPNNPILVNSFAFSGYSVGGARCTIEDDRGVVCHFDGDADLTTQVVSFGGTMPLYSLRCTTLDSGRLSVFIE